MCAPRYIEQNSAIGDYICLDASPRAGTPERGEDLKQMRGRINVREAGEVVASIFTALGLIYTVGWGDWEGGFFWGLYRRLAAWNNGHDCGSADQSREI
jgi:hypothetical protein